MFLARQRGSLNEGVKAGAPARSYPVVYLLHGYTDDNTGWLQFGEINRLADKAIAEGTIAPMILVMPNGDSS